MNPLLVVAIPLLLIILGMILNSLDLGFTQPPSSTGARSRKANGS
jgi:hypothetical protein